MIEQGKLAKVIGGLDACLEGLCEACSYRDVDAPGGCKDALMYDAFALLKAHEPRVMTLEEIIQWEGAFWLEFLEEDSDYYTRYGYALFCGSTPDIIEVIAQDGFRPLYAFIRSEYGVRWRCWTSRPDQATREATPWD